MITSMKTSQEDYTDSQDQTSVVKKVDCTSKVLTSFVKKDVKGI